MKDFLSTFFMVLGIIAVIMCLIYLWVNALSTP